MAFRRPFPGGAHPDPQKRTLDAATLRLDPPAAARLLVPMAMHLGAPARPLVAKGARVLVGQPIGAADRPMSAWVHSPVSGTVTAIRRILQSSGAFADAVEIASDGLGEVDPSVRPPDVVDRASFVAAIAASGLVGLGGASFPTHIKLSPPPDKAPDCLVINAAECEPYITSDYRACLEEPDAIADGILQVLRYMDIPRAVIGIEDNKPRAAAALANALKAAAAREADSACRAAAEAAEIRILPTLYPQGAEKMLVHACTGRTIPTGGLPHDVRVMVLNVSTVGFISHYLATGMPLVRRRLTLDGDLAVGPGNYDVPVGLMIADLLALTGGTRGEPEKILMGGPMMGVALDRPDTPVIKANNAILVLSGAVAALPAETACIRCARCVQACPMRLLPTAIDAAARLEDADLLEPTNPLDCIECGCCSYVCPAKRHLVQSIRLGKTILRTAQARKKAEDGRRRAAKEVRP